jgi:hypothetical protein
MIPKGWEDLECDLHSAVLAACEKNGIDRMLARKIASDATIDTRHRSIDRLKKSA